MPFYKQIIAHLNLDDPSQAEIYDEIIKAKEQRRWRPTFRNALRLYFSLKRGDISILLELFPNIRQQLMPPEDNNEEILELAKAIQTLAQNLATTETQPKPQLKPPMLSSPTTPMLDDLPDVEVTDAVPTNGEQIGANLLASFNLL
ncbi:MAG: hypothetical protein CUN55_15180 [Phototrophicales bacterium]|nr:MAG: hypothetical protein CUN55_15180 [Phototrophicales bacterium]